MPAEPSPETSSPARTPIDGWRAFWIFALLIAAMIFLRDLLNTRDGLSISGDALWGRDFVNVYTAGTLTLAGQLDILYSVEAYRAFQLDLFDAGLRYHNYSYPPVTLLYAWLFAWLPYPLALLVWLGGTGVLFALAARPYCRGAGVPMWAALLAPACLINLWAGHYGFLIGALWLGAFHWLDRKPVLAGVLIGLMVVKPHLAVLAPLVLLRQRAWLAFAAAAATAILLVGLSMLLFGMELWRVYLGETALLQAAMVDDVGAFFLTMMPTLSPSLAIIGLPTALALVVQLMVAAGAIVLLLWALPADPRKAGLATAIATFLVLPYAFAYDMTVAGLAGLILFRHALEHGSRGQALLAGLAAFVPIAVMYLNVIHLPVAPVLIGWQLAAILGLVRWKS
jgi:hypothetical protein